MEVLADEKAWSRFRAAAAYALGDLRAEKAFGLLKGMALGKVPLNDPADEIRTAAITSVGKFQTEEAAKVIQAILRNKDWHRRSFLASAVIAACNMKLVAALDDLDRLAAGAARFDRDLGTCIAFNLAKFTDHPEAVVRILRKLTSHINYNVPRAAIKTAAGMGSEGKKLILDCLKHEEAMVRIAAVQQLGALKAADAVPDLQRLLDNEKEQDYVKREIRKALEEIRGKER